MTRTRNVRWRQQVTAPYQPYNCESEQLLSYSVLSYHGARQVNGILWI